MQDSPLLISGLLDYAQTYHHTREIVSRDADGRMHRYNYGEAAVRTRKLAAALLSLKVAQGERIGTLAMNGYRHFELFYGVSGIGAVLHTVNPRLFDEQVEYIINHAEDTIMFLEPAFAELFARLLPKLSSIKRIYILGDEAQVTAAQALLPNAESYEDLLEQHEPLAAWPTFDERSASSLCYTSGTTGNPKGVLYSHRSTVLHAMAACQNSAMGISSFDVIMPIAPLYHGNGWSTPYLAPMAGAKLVLPGPKMDGESIQSLIEGEGVTFTVAVPTVFTILLDYLEASGKRIDSLSRTTIGGAAVPHTMIELLAQKYGCTVRQVWGMTELSPLGTMTTLTPAVCALGDDVRKAIELKQGRAQFGIELLIKGEDGKRLPMDGLSAGALWVRGPWAAAGYFKSEGGDVLDDDGWFPTGDVASLDPLGYLSITDRVKDVIKSGGEWISSTDIENVCYQHPKVRMAAVVGVRHPKWDERPLLALVLKAGAAMDKAEILEHLSRKVARWWLPDDVVFLDELPMTATGKIRKVALRQTYAEHYADVQRQPHKATSPA
jgi:acyl-CoA synthetase (AMP-forming)/AMP-acid ligase II